MKMLNLFFRLRFMALTGCILIQFLAGGFNKTANAATGQGVYRQLQASNVLEDYMADLVLETVQNLVNVSGDWHGARVNTRYQPGYINLYLIDGMRLPYARNILREFDIQLAGWSLGNATVDERTGIIFINTHFLKKFIAYSLMVENDVSSLQAAAYVKLNRPDSFRELWHPAYNQKLQSRRYREMWLIAFRGTLAFIIGHEMGHIKIGSHQIDFHNPLGFENKEERDIRWACPQLVDPSYHRKQQIEKRADDYAVGLISRLLFPDNVSPRRLWYELGAHQYMLYQMKTELLSAIHVTDSQNIHRVMQYQLGNQLYQRLLASEERDDIGSVHVFYPETHPATINRIVESLQELTISRYSSYYGENFGVESELVLLNQLVNQECQRLRQRYNQ